MPFEPDNANSKDTTGSHFEPDKEEPSGLDKIKAYLQFGSAKEQQKYQPANPEEVKQARQQATGAIGAALLSAIPMAAAPTAAAKLGSAGLTAAKAVGPAIGNISKFGAGAYLMGKAMKKASD